MNESVEIPPERLPSVANEQASSSKSIAGVLLFVCAIAIVSALGMVTDGNGAEPADTYGDSANAGIRIAGAIFGLMIFGALPGRYGIRAARNASRATRAAKITTTDPAFTWRLSGNEVLASDASGMPHPELSFTVNGKLRKALLHVPRASVVV